MVDEHKLRLLLKAEQPVDKPVLVRMAAYAGQRVDLRVDLNVLVEEFDFFQSVNKQPPQRAHRLIADEQHHALLAPEVMLQVMAHASRVAHTAGRDYDLRGLVLVYRLRFRLRHRDLQAGEHDWVDAGAYQRLHLLIDILRVALKKDARRLDGEGAVHVDGEVAVPGDEAALLYLADKVQHLLRTADGEGRNDHVAAAVEHELDALCKLRHVVRQVNAVQPVAVCGLDDQIFRVLHMLRILEYWLVLVADVSAESDLALLAVFVQPDLDGRRAEQVPDVGEADADAVVDLYHLAVAAGAEAAHYPRNVIKVIQRLDLRAAAAQRFARFPLRVRHLDVRAVAQHDVAERGRRGACVHRAAEALLVQQRQVAGVVYVRVGQQDEINAAGADGQLLVHENVLALLHAAVDQTALVADLDESAAACDFMRRA